jgi:Holliday junction resolvase RusA-like endonuclease
MQNPQNAEQTGFVVPIKPAGKEVIRQATAGHFFKSTPDRSRENWIRGFAKNAGLELIPLGVPVYAEYWFYLEPPQSWSFNRQERALNNEILPTGRPDTENAAKLVSDALQQKNKTRRSNETVPDNQNISGINATAFRGMLR